MRLNKNIIMRYMILNIALISTSGANGISLGGMGIKNDSPYTIRVTLSYKMDCGWRCKSWVREITKEIQPGAHAWFAGDYNWFEAQVGVYYSEIQIDYLDDNNEWKEKMAIMPLNERAGDGTSLFSGNYCMTIYIDHENKYNYSIHSIRPGADCPFEGAKD